VLPQTVRSRASIEADPVRSGSNGDRFRHLERKWHVYRPGRMPSAKAGYPGCVRLHCQASDGRKRWRRGTVAGDRRYTGFAQRGTSAVASWRVDNSATDFGFARTRGRCAMRNRFELWSQSASSRFATSKSSRPPMISESIQ